ncbi:2-oxo acid dehydrogenase subunit E2 [Ktedonosporobacter rubrisoli]|uniref:Dihydrolipoamide acetyltransferase component of pyruvate dehydrogenase complex n=1 Tax=Ktedonosporobacter rubrisoli TaxID=2509675 RepID=A0A4P6JTE5_KTERU|nr:dihydrolipoamide acetyltransferase family protein [Ktedonosporobacter rubrisoli]QBD78532.1 2-oxo acid dehydrogenase subunit E2 [Ktedonosporobacter rubrisoli]
MEKPLTMPKLGMTMTEGTVLNWIYKEGDLVEKGEPLLEVMTDKVNIEVEAPFTARLKQILAQDGETLPVGAPLAVLVDDTEDSTASTQAAQAVSRSAPAAVASTPTTASSPALAIREQTSSAPVASTPAAKREAALHGIDLHAIVETGARPPLHRDDVLAFLQSKQDKAVRATPIAQKMAREHQIDLAALAALKAGEKVTRADIEAHLAAGPQSTNHVASDAVPTPVPNEQAKVPEDSELLPLTPVRRIIAQRMLTSINTIPHIYLDTEIDMSEAQRTRQALGQSLKAQGEPAPSLTAILLRAVAAALTLHPEVNAALETGADGKEAIRRWHNVNIGIAVDTEQALLTPVLRNAQQRNVPELARELRRLTQLARDGALKPEDLSGATFTVSNLGMYGIDTFHAIIVPGQSSILAVGKITKRGVVIEDDSGERIEIRPIMKVSLSADHRVLDGASGSRFLQRLKAFLENPYLLL